MERNMSIMIITFFALCACAVTWAALEWRSKGSMDRIVAFISAVVSWSVVVCITLFITSC